MRKKCNFANYFNDEEMKFSSLLCVSVLTCGVGKAQTAIGEIYEPAANIQDSVQAADTVIKRYLPLAARPAETLRSNNRVSPLESFQNLIVGFRNNYQAMMDRWDDIFIPDAPAGVRSDADFYKLAMPATYYPQAVEQAFSIDGWQPETPYSHKAEPARYVFQPPRVTRSEDIDRMINRQLLSFYIQYPNLVTKNEMDFSDLEPLSEKMKIRKPKKEKVLNLLDSPSPVNQVSEQDLLVMKPNFWSMSGNGYAQFSQNYISDNWYKGGESTVSLLSGFVWQLNYDDQQRVQFENKLEWKLGFITAPSDTLHQYKTSEDLFRISSKLGYRAIYNWYYTISGEFKTQFFSKYDTNSDNLVSALFSPSELNIGLGMDYKYIQGDICNLSVLINPLNYTRYSVASDRVDPTKFNIEEGHKVENQLGSRLEATLKWSVMSNLLWESRFSYTTNYEKVLSEWENTFTFAFNRFFSTKLFVHARFDDSVSRNPGDSYFQLQELLSLGFNYTW